MSGTEFWDDAARRGPASVTVGGIELRTGSRVRLRPRPGRDIFDLALAGRTARVETVEQDIGGETHLAVTVGDDPGQELGEGRFPAHRFFFSPDEVEPLPLDDDPARGAPRILVAGIGNIFLGDDGFGVAAAERLAARRWPAGVTVRDFGIRGLDLAYALQSGYDAAVLVDAMPRGGVPGTLVVLEPELDDATPAMVESHGMDPARVLSLVRALGGTLPRLLVVGCEPQPLPPDHDPDEIVAGLSEPAQVALDRAVLLVESLVRDLAAELRAGPPPQGSST